MMIAPKRLSSGSYVDLADFKLGDIDLVDINQSLNHTYRFNGHYKDKPPLTVAQHTVLVMRLAEINFPGEENVRFNCLLHDFAEAYYGDISTPLKKILGDASGKYIKQIDSIIYTQLWKLPTPLDEDIENKTKICDLFSLDIERRSMWKSQVGKEHWPSVQGRQPLREKEELFDWAQSLTPNLVEEYEKFGN